MLNPLPHSPAHRYIRLRCCEWKSLDRAEQRSDLLLALSTGVYMTIHPRSIVSRKCPEKVILEQLLCMCMLVGIKR